jgi:hypothetical protein
MEVFPPSVPSKTELLAVSKGLRGCDPAAIDRAVTFLVQESRGNWHNRARAKFSRRLKHCQLQPNQSKALVDCILARLQRGYFSEQFADQLRLALYLDRDALLTAAQEVANSQLLHVQRYANWVLSAHGAGLRPNNSFKPNPLRGSA